MKENKIGFKSFVFLHITVLIFAISLVFNKLASNYLALEGFTDWRFIITLFGYAFLTVLYAVVWQLNLEKYKLSFLYMNRSFYMVWSQIFAVFIFGNVIYWNNILGLVLIIAGVWVNSRDV